MGLHSARWRVHASAVDDVPLIEQGLRWLTGEGCEVNVERGKSWHGSEQTIIEASISGRKASIYALSRLGEEGLRHLLENGITNRLDEDKVLHIRISLAELVCGEVTVVDDDSSEAAAKGRFKVESYPGQEVGSIATELIHELIEKA
ncbi:MAG: RNA-binding domain-containing protein [Candidatus Thalassarchaeum sp.]